MFKSHATIARLVNTMASMIFGSATFASGE